MAAAVDGLYRPLASGAPAAVTPAELEMPDPFQPPPAGQEPAAEAASRRAWLLLVLLVGVWVFEIAVVQFWTTLPDGEIAATRLAKDTLRRASLAAAACTVGVCVLRGWMLAAACAAWAVAANVLLVYAAYFGAPLSWPVIATQWREGLAVSDAAVSLVSWTGLAVAAAGCGAKLAIARAVPWNLLPRRGLRGLAAAAACAYGAMAVALVGYQKPITQIRIGTPEYVYGYAVAWGAEAFLLDDETILAEATAKAEAKSHRLAAVEDPFGFSGHLAVVQVESLDFPVLDARVAGEPVTPFMAGLRDRSMHYAVRPFHSSGSSEADFSLLMAATPIGRFNPFQVRGFSYADALPRLARERGYRPVAFHGNSGGFFQRRQAYEQMGFDELFFTEELGPRQVVGKWDDELFAFSARMLAAARDPALHFIITITSHTPFDRLPSDRRELFPEPKTIEERYLNSMRYVDRALEDYVAAIPDGTTVVIYGDHESNVRGYLDGSAHENRVPWFIFTKGRDLASRQRSRDAGLALSGELTQLDMACFLRDRLARSRPEPVDDRPRRTVIAGADDGRVIR